MADGSSPPPSSAVVDGWSREEEKAFEEALADLAPWNEGDEEEEEEKKLQELAARVSTKSPAEVRTHYEVLVEDIRAIEGGKVAVPCYVGKEKQREKEGEREKKGGVFDGGDRRCGGGGGGGGGGLSKSEQERRKGIPWTEEEHKLFLLGLSKFGKGDWRSISRNYVISRTPTQVASHAQKYFIRLNSMNRERRRSSIHDITSVNGGEVASSQPPITGHNNAAAIGPSANNPPQTCMSGMGMYGAPVGQPLTGHMVSAVGTPVMLPPGRAPYVVPLAYPVAPPPAMHQ